MGKVLLVRESNYVGAAAKYNIYLDNKKVGAIGNGAVLELTIDNGEHEMYLRSAILPIGKSNILFFKSSSSTVTKILVKSVMSKISGIKLEMVSNSTNELKEVDDKYSALEKLNDLKNKNIISTEEFNEQKKKIMEER